MKIKVLDVEIGLSKNTAEVNLEFREIIPETNKECRINIFFNEEGVYDTFPALTCGDNLEDYYVTAGEMIKKIKKFQGAEAKILCEKAINIESKYSDDCDKIYENSEYKNAQLEKRKLSDEIDGLYIKIQRARKEDKKLEYIKERDILEEKRKTISEILDSFNNSLLELKKERRESLKTLEIEI